ncbi:MAG TPA: hypothetical protein VJA47_02610 [archaeon]|nr:hypothetical protein [archaeon]
MKAARYIEKYSHMFFGDPSIVAQQRFLRGEISSVQYELECTAVANDLYRVLLNPRRKR